MASRGKSAKRVPRKGAGMSSPLDFGGVDPATIMELMKNIPPNPITGKTEVMDVMRYMEQNPAAVKDIIEKVQSMSENRPSVDLATYDYKALGKSIVHESFWVLQLEPLGFVDKAGNEVDPSRAHSSGVRPTFIMYCYDDRGSYRITHQVVGLPDSDVVLEVIQRSIASPELPLKPCLPWFFLLGIKLAQHADALRPFLDSLPKPFHWRIETREEAQGVHDGVDNLNKEGKQQALMFAERSKTAGNKAFSSKDRQGAIKAYQEALGFVKDALVQKPNVHEEKEAKKLQAVCLANRAAAYLLPGEGMDPVMALEDGKAAEKVDPNYAKAYIRQATASQALGKSDDAKDAIARGLKRKELENDVGLVDRMIELVTDGKGFSNDEGTFKESMLDLMLNDRRSADRLKGIGGLWKKRCDAQFAKFKR